VAQGIFQRELAQRLDVHESQVSRDEREEYFGVTLERAITIPDDLMSACVPKWSGALDGDSLNG
jgi:hypothetical protein